ncbi:MAG: PhoH family protein [Bacteroidia bacterium]|jgi:phosphate starvation-inducible PhoH-like protein|nr:PhoH family protein [Bacteroidia bacterium]GIV24109.1 MAG: phosphate starvation protein PhoH [Bacteroidia bacterium]
MEDKPIAESEILLEGVDLLSFYGVGNENLQLLRNAYPSVKLVARGSSIKASGDPEAIARLEEIIAAMVHEVRQQGRLPSQRVREIVGRLRSGEKAPSPESGPTILRTLSGQTIAPRTEGQKQLAQAIETHDITFAVGPAGTGKTYTAVAFAVKALKERLIRKIILTRPAVEAGESLGFLPGDLKEKVAPYLRPLYDSLEEMLSSEKLQQLLEQNVIEIAPLAYMRGRTLNQAFIILDEAQNATRLQMKMFLTRFGHGSKIVITGDLSQIDLPRPETSGLLHAIQLLEGVPGIAVVRMTETDIVRHPLVTEIVRLYEEDTRKAHQRS